jgi:hypothetical protein
MTPKKENARNKKADRHRASTFSWRGPTCSGVRDFQIEVPASWSAINDDDGMIKLVARRGAANIIAGPERLPPQITLVEAVEDMLGHSGPDPVAIEPEEITGAGWFASVARRAERVIEGHKVRQLAVAIEDGDVSPTDERTVYVLLGSWVVDQDCESCSTDELLLRKIMSSFTYGNTAWLRNLGTWSTDQPGAVASG